MLLTESHGVWDFYMFDPPELDDEQEILLV